MAKDAKPVTHYMVDGKPVPRESVPEAQIVAKMRGRGLIEEAPVDTSTALIADLAALAERRRNQRTKAGEARGEAQVVEATRVAAVLVEKYNELAKTTPRRYCIGKLTQWAQRQPAYSSWDKRRIRRAIERHNRK